MASNVLILATRYDSASYYTHKWALDLHDDLLRKGHVCLLLGGSNLCRSGPSLIEAVACVDYVVFYGHGEADAWTLLPPGPSASAVPLVDLANFTVLDGRHLYAGCCHSLHQLGPAYTSHFGAAEFVGYDQAFGFEMANHEAFRDVVNASVVSYVSGASAQQVAADLANEWDALEQAFMAGKLKHRPNAPMAAHRARDNRSRVGMKP